MPKFRGLPRGKRPDYFGPKQQRYNTPHAVGDWTTRPSRGNRKWSFFLRGKPEEGLRFQIDDPSAARKYRSFRRMWCRSLKIDPIPFIPVSDNGQARGWRFLSPESDSGYWEVIAHPGDDEQSEWCEYIPGQPQPQRNCITYIDDAGVEQRICTEEPGPIRYEYENDPSDIPGNQCEYGTQCRKIGRVTYISDASGLLQPGNVIDIPGVDLNRVVANNTVDFDLGPCSGPNSTLAVRNEQDIGEDTVEWGNGESYTGPDLLVIIRHFYANYNFKLFSQGELVLDKNYRENPNPVFTSIGESGDWTIYVDRDGTEVFSDGPFQRNPGGSWFPIQKQVPYYDCEEQNEGDPPPPCTLVVYSGDTEIGRVTRADGTCPVMPPINSGNGNGGGGRSGSRLPTPGIRCTPVSYPGDPYYETIWNEGEYTEPTSEYYYTCTCPYYSGQITSLSDPLDANRSFGSGAPYFRYQQRVCKHVMAAMRANGDLTDADIPYDEEVEAQFYEGLNTRRYLETNPLVIPLQVCTPEYVDKLMEELEMESEPRTDSKIGMTWHDWDQSDKFGKWGDNWDSASKF